MLTFCTSPCGSNDTIALYPRGLSPHSFIPKCIMYPRVSFPFSEEPCFEDIMGSKKGEV